MLKPGIIHQYVHTGPRMFQNYRPAAQLGPLHNQVCHMNLRLWFISRHTYVVFVRKHLHAIIIEMYTLN